MAFGIIGSALSLARYFDLTVLLLVLHASTALAVDRTSFTGLGVGIMDGDTIEVLRDRQPVRIRLYGIDCPEKGQDFSQVAKSFTSERVYRKEVLVMPVDIDKYGRIVAEVRVNDGQESLNLLLLREGLAWWYARYTQRPDYKESAREAQEAKRGLWSMKDSVPPWEYRKGEAFRRGVGGQRAAVPAGAGRRH